MNCPETHNGIACELKTEHAGPHHAADGGKGLGLNWGPIMCDSYKFPTNDESTGTQYCILCRKSIDLNAVWLDAVGPYHPTCIPGPIQQNAYGTRYSCGHYGPMDFSDACPICPQLQKLEAKITELTQYLNNAVLLVEEIRELKI